MQLTAVFVEVPEGFIAFVEELPGANTQGATLEEARENLQEAVAMVLEANRELAAKSLAGQKVTREPFAFSHARFITWSSPPGLTRGSAGHGRIVTGGAGRAPPNSRRARTSRGRRREAHRENGSRPPFLPPAHQGG